jgi:HK97 family phage prohead protease/HK97 family phage major capsid protein
MTMVRDNVERRCTVADLEVRVAEGGKRPRLEGYAVRYGSTSEDLGFREIIEPGAFSKHLRTDPDVRALIEHDASKIIGRTTSRTLQVIEDDGGVRVSIDPPNNQTGNDLIESVRRGDLSAMSFGFRALNDRWETRDGEPFRTIVEGALYDVSVTAFPSYPDTTIAVRSLDRWRKENAMPEVTLPVETPEVNVPTPQTPEINVPAPAPPEVTLPTPERRSVPAQPANTPKSARDPMEWRDYRTGQEVRVLRPDQKFADYHKGSEPLSLGRAIRAMITGTWEGAEAEQRALSTTANPTAGILVPNPLAARVIDLARARSVLTRAGAQTVAMTSGTLTIARVSSDATMEVKAENTSFTGYDVEFDAVELVAYTIGTVVKMSRELAADAPNAVSIIEDKVARALAAKIDLYGLTGTGSQQPLGLTNFGSTNTEAVGGSVDYDNILNGIKACEVDNHTPNAYIASPTNANVLAQLKVNAEANHYAEPPAAVRNLSALITSAMPDATMALGDFSQFIIGLRQSPLIEVTTEGGDAFEKHQVFVKVTWRGCFNTTHRDAFCLLTGIS